MLIGYSQLMLTGMVAGLICDITTFVGEEEYAELDTYFAFRHFEIDHCLRQALTLAILIGAREAAFYAALVRGTAAGSRDPRRSHRDADARVVRLQAGYGTFWDDGVRRASDTASVFGSGGSWSATAVGDTEQIMILDEMPSDLVPASSGGVGPSASDGTRKKKKRPPKTESVGSETPTHTGVQAAVAAIHQAVPSCVAPFVITRDMPSWSWASTMSINIATETPVRRKTASVAPPLLALQLLPEISRT